MAHPLVFHRSHSLSALSALIRTTTVGEREAVGEPAPIRLPLRFHRFETR